jgi:diguanylate cyclase (GGDEF)-like protein
MSKRNRYYTLGVYGLLLALSAGFSIKIYHDSRALYGETVALIERDLPILASLSRLRANVVEREPVLYEYYATTDRARFQLRWRRNLGLTEELGAKVGQDFPGHPRLLVLDDLNRQVDELALELDRVLVARQVDWDAARTLLEEISRKALVINANLDRLAEEVRGRVDSRANAAHMRVDTINWTVLFYSGAMLLLAIAAGYFINSYLVGARERRRLSMFAERNPNPVLNLDVTGGVLYANPAAHSTLAALGYGSGPLTLLFPWDSSARLAEMLARGQATRQWNYTALGREYETTLQYLHDFECFNAYLVDVSGRKEAERRMEYLAEHDPLTDLPNRRRFIEDIRRQLASGRMGAVVLLSIDRLRAIVDGVGHGVADQLLQAVARRLLRALADCADLCSNAHLYRFEGAVFGLLLPCLESDQSPELITRKIARDFESPIHAENQAFFLGVSIGASLFPTDDGDAVNLISHADRALQQVKQRGGGGYRAYDRDLSIQAVERLALESDLRHALERNELFIQYQPQVDVASLRIVGVEALLRWRHPIRGLISPAQFIPLAEASGLIAPIGVWVLETACAQAQAWHTTGLPRITMAINLSARQFVTEDLARDIARVLTHTGLPAQYLELEVTESMAMDDVERSVRMLRAMKDLGACISIDDFGTGYSSLAYLRRLPIDKLKVDQSFVRNLESDPGDAALVRSVVQLGHSLNLSVIAEGVETPGQLEFLRATGCEEIQGYYFSRPLDSSAMEILLGRDIAALQA